MVADPTKAPENRVNYRNALQGVYRMVRDEGASSLFRGLGPNTVSVPGVPAFPHPLLYHYTSLNPAGPSHSDERITIGVLRLLQGRSPGQQYHRRWHAPAFPRIRCCWYGRDDDMCTCGRAQK